MFKNGGGVGLTRELNHSINQRRKQEHQWETFNTIKQTTEKHRFVADWESKTSIKIQKGQLQKRLDELRKEKERDLEKRRSKLADKLAKEDEQYKMELVFLISFFLFFDVSFVCLLIPNVILYINYMVFGSLVSFLFRRCFTNPLLAVLTKRIALWFPSWCTHNTMNVLLRKGVSKEK